jgi:hypothetical protein
VSVTPPQPFLTSVQMVQPFVTSVQAAQPFRTQVEGLPTIPDTYSYEVTGLPTISLAVEELPVIRLSVENIPPIRYEVAPVEIRLTEFPSVRTHLPADFAVGFSFLGMELGAIRLCGEAQVITEPYRPNPCENCGPVVTRPDPQLLEPRPQGVPASSTPPLDRPS